MATKSEGADVRIRNRVSGFLNLLQDNHPKRMLKACNELASEFPNSHIAKSALAIAYIKIGQPDKSSALLEEALKHSSEWILDQGTTYRYTACMKILGRSDMLEKVWEKAVAQDKTSIKNHEMLFAACLRSGNSNRQISCALELWKLTNNDKYLMWSIVARALPELQDDLPRAASIAAAYPHVATHDSNGNPIEPSKILQLAYMMFNAKLVTPGKVTRHTDIGFMARVLIQQNQCTQALELLRSDLAKRLYGIESMRLNEEAALLLRMGQTEEAAEIYEKLITEHNSDEWSWYIGYFTALFGKDRPISLTIEPAKAERATSFIHKLKEKYGDDPAVRGPRLAELELDKLINDSKLAPSLLIIYFRLFCTKPSCYRDMHPYLSYIPVESQLNLLEAIKGYVKLVPDFEPDMSLSIVCTICNYKSLYRTIHAPSMTPEARDEEIVHLWSLYNATRKLEHPREATERFWADDLLLLIAHYHCDAYVADMHQNGTITLGGDLGFRINRIEPNPFRSPLRHLVHAAIALEHGVAHSRWNFQFRLLLNEVYAALGASRSCLEQFDAVDVKHVQLDSVGYMFLDPMLRYATISDVNKVAKRSTTFYDDSRASGDYMLEAFQHNAWHKIKEVAYFADQLHHSAHQLALQTDQTLLQAAEASSLQAAVSYYMSHNPLQTAPASLEDAKNLTKNHDGDAIDWWSLTPPKFKHVELLAGNVRSTCYPDEKQDARIVANSLLLKILNVLAAYQPTAPGEKATSTPCAPLNTLIQSLVVQLDTIVTNEFSTETHFEALAWSIVTNTFKFVMAVFEASPALLSEKADTPHYNQARESAQALTGALDILNRIWKAGSDREFIVSTLNAPMLTCFLVRSLCAIPMCLPLLPKLLPGKSRPKTPEEVKAQTSLLKAAIRDIAEACRKELVHLEQLLKNEAIATSNFELDPSDQLTDVPSAVSPKTVSKVAEAISYARRDVQTTLLSFVQNKLRDFKAL